MRIASFRTPDEGTDRFGIVVNGGDPCADIAEVEVADLTDALTNVTQPLDILAMIDGGHGEVLDRAIRRAPRAQVPVADLQAPVRRPHKFLGIGFNYLAHAEEVGVSVNKAPLFFNKQVNCITGPRAGIPLPAGCDMLDYEGELALVIGRRCRDVSPDRASEVIGGWLACNDVSARDWQRQAPTVTLGKSHDGFGPVGPWLVTPDEIGNPQVLGIRTTVNGDLRQDGCTADMIHPILEQIAYLSSRCTLEVGDLLTTGSPAGSAQGRTPPPWLQAGDVVRVVVEGIGMLENVVVSEPVQTVIDAPPEAKEPRIR